MQYILKIHFDVLFYKVGGVCCSGQSRFQDSTGPPASVVPSHSFVVHFMFAMFQVLCLSNYQLCLCVHPWLCQLSECSAPQPQRPPPFMAR